MKVTKSLLTLRRRRYSYNRSQRNTLFLKFIW